MNFLKRMIIKWLQSDNYAEEPSYPNVKGKGSILKSVNSVQDYESLNHQHFWNIKIFPATGGKIVEINNYDERKNQSGFTRYLITDDKDFSTSLGKIISMEFLKS